MHTTAMEYGKAFFNSYVTGKNNLTIVDIGALDVNGGLRAFAPQNSNYIGLDFVKGKSVDIVLTDAYNYPLPDNYADFIITSSCFEHSQFFWLTFMEALRILKPNGILYLNVPSNGMYHRYPTDNWRFYPDAAKALSDFAKTQGLNTVALESFIGKERDFWKDFVGVFIKDSQYAYLYPNRIYNSVSKDLSPSNIWDYGNTEIINYQEFMHQADYYAAYMNSVASAGLDDSKLEQLWTEVIDNIGGKPLCIAAQNGDLRMVKFLLSKNVSVEFRASNGLTPLYIAVQNKHSEIAELLLQAGANTEVALLGGSTPLYFCAYYGDTYQAALLLKHNAKTEVTVNGIGIVQAAAQNGHIDTAKLLLNGLNIFCLHNTEEQFVEICGKDLFHETN